MAATKRAAVLCPGPSLFAAIPTLQAGTAGPYDVTVAVNRAAAVMPADFWAILDAESFDDVEPKGTPTIVIGERACKQLTRKHPNIRSTFDITLREDLAAPPRSTFWYRWTALVAVVTAWNFGAHEIDVYGADLKGKADFDGVILPRQHRDKRRWQRERSAWLKVGAWMRSERVFIRRLGTDRHPSTERQAQ